MRAHRYDAIGALSVRARARTDAEQYLRRRLNADLERQARAIGQWLHDEAGQLLAAAHIELAQAARDLPAPAGERLLVVRRHLAAVEKQLRDVARELRPRVLDDEGFVAALLFLARGFDTRYGIPTTVHTRLARRLPADVEVVLYRVIQAGLTNIAQHAHATRVHIDVTMAGGRVRCTIRDDGVGFAAAAGAGEIGQTAAGLGLHGIRERVGALGGTLTIRSRCGTSTALIVSIPLED